MDEEQFKAMSQPVTDDDIRNAIELIEQMLKRQPANSVKAKVLQIVIDQAEALLAGEPSMLSREVIDRTNKNSYWN